MKDPVIERLMERLGQVERDRRRWKWIIGPGLAFLGLVFLVAVVSARAVDEIKAQRFALVDGTGSELAVLELRFGFPVLTLSGKDEQGTTEPRVELSVEHFGAARLALGLGRNPTGAELAVFGTAPPMLLLYSGGLPTATLAGGAKPYLAFTDWRRLKEGKIPEIWRAP